MSFAIFKILSYGVVNISFDTFSLAAKYAAIPVPKLLPITEIFSCLFITSL
ncbi:MAG: hypothetical protein MJK08_14365 [Campylobacterales bacterium]|nr:hypothetical protein [Campylobacterales bacterium]